MADPSKTERATPKRRRETRNRGQVAKSIDLSTGIDILAAFFVFQFFGAGLFEQLQDVVRGSIQAAASPHMAEATFTDMGRATLLTVARLLLPILLSLAVIGYLSQFVQVGPLWATDPLKPRLSKLNILKNARRVMISQQAIVQLVKGFVKLAIVGGFMYFIARGQISELASLSQMPLRDAVSETVRLCLNLGMKCAFVLLALGVADYLYARRKYFADLRMTKEEVKEETRQAEGDPKIKNRQRRVRMEMFQRMLRNVPTADVVVTNPTHYAVALKYDTLTMDAPRVVAKGKDLLAQRIKQLAAEHNIPVVENVPLAQALYKSCPVGREIPAFLYQAVAEVLAFVFRVRRGMQRAVA